MPVFTTRITVFSVVTESTMYIALFVCVTKGVCEVQGPVDTTVTPACMIRYAIRTGARIESDVEVSKTLRKL